MTITRSAAALAAAACLAVLAVLAGCASHAAAPGGSATPSQGTSTTTAPSAPATPPVTPAPATTAPGGQASAPGAAPAGPFQAGTGTVANPFNGMCMTLAAAGTAVVAWKCSPGTSSQQWTGYSDGTLRTAGMCLDVTGPGAGAKARVAACTGAASQKWAINQTSFNDFGSIVNTGTGTALTDPGGSTANGTPLVMGPDRGDLSGPWHVSFRHYAVSSPG